MVEVPSGKGENLVLCLLSVYRSWIEETKRRHVIDPITRAGIGLIKEDKNYSNAKTTRIDVVGFPTKRSSSASGAAGVLEVSEHITSGGHDEDVGDVFGRSVTVSDSANGWRMTNM